MKEITFKINKIIVLLSDGTDKISIDIEAPTAFPEMKYQPWLNMDARANYGAEYVRNVFGIEPEIIDARRK